MAITPEADESVAKQQLALARGRKRQLQAEFATLATAVVVARRQAITDQIDVLNRDIADLLPRVPSDTGG